MTFYRLPLTVPSVRRAIFAALPWILLLIVQSSSWFHEISHLSSADQHCPACQSAQQLSSAVSAVSYLPPVIKQVPESRTNIIFPIPRFERDTIHNRGPPLLTAS